MYCMAPTPFSADGSIDHRALAGHLERMTAAGAGIYPAGPGAGEGHSLTTREFREVCETAVHVCAGKVPVIGAPREAASAADVLTYAIEAVAAGVDSVQIYQLNGGHGMVPNPNEQETYFRDLLEAIRVPVTISVHFTAGYRASVELLSRLHGDYSHIVAFNVMGADPEYFTSLRDAIPASIAMNVRMNQLVQGLALGASGALAAEPNIIPETCQSILEAWTSGDGEALARSTTAVQRFANVVNRWSPSTARWVKMAMRVLRLPGGAGPLRKPYLMPSEAAQLEMFRLFRDLGIPELDGLLAAAA
jgi:4-hydroxy-tetrahydrodipicolinate synthase